MKRFSLLLCCLFLLFSAHAQFLYGTTTDGGYEGRGVLFQYDAAAKEYSVVYRFRNATGESPSGSLVQAGDGKLFGVAESGGQNNNGLVFSFTPSTQSYVVVHSFTGADGAAPVGGLTKGRDGLLYGIANRGGAAGTGVIYTIDPATGAFNTLQSLYTNPFVSSRDGLMLAKDGLFYGMTNNGGTARLGTIYRFNPTTNTVETLWEASWPQGVNPYGKLLEGKDGLLYGMTMSGGNNTAGVLFSFHPATKTYKILKHFGGHDGANPYGSLIQAKDGKLYGVTLSGGEYTYGGVLFSYDPNTATYKKLFDFLGDGSNPAGTLLQASDGLLYGTTMRGGSEDYGALFSFDPATKEAAYLNEFQGYNGSQATYSALIELQSASVLYYRDQDGDGYGDAANSVKGSVSAPPSGYVSNSTDCDDGDAAINPKTVWYLDADGDGYYVGVELVQCKQPGPGYRNSGIIWIGDCDDANAKVNIGSPEVCDGIDNNCNGVVDEECKLPVSSFTLINAATNKVVGQLSQGSQINLADFKGGAISIRADVSEKVGSIILRLTGTMNHTQVENTAPYAIMGDAGNKYKPFMPLPGNYTLTATPYSGTHGKGTAGVPTSVTFTVVNRISLSGLYIVNAKTDTIIGQLHSGAVIDLAINPDINILAKPGEGMVGSVRFSIGYGSVTRIENSAPFAFASDNKGNFSKWKVQPGYYFIGATPFSQKHARGMSGIGVGVQFRIIDSRQQRSTIGAIGINPILQEQPSGLQLKVFPNPLEASGYVQYSVKASGRVSLLLFDASGSLVSKVFSGAADGGVTYQRALPVTGLPTGVYFCRILTSDGSSAVVKVIKR